MGRPAAQLVVVGRLFGIRYRLYSGRSWMAMDKQALSPRLQEVITAKQAFFEKYEAFIDFYELERLIERRGRLTMPELALHIVRVRGQKILEIYKTEAALEVLVASHEQVQRKMIELYEQYEAARTEKPELAREFERMMLELLEKLEQIPLEDLARFRASAFSQN